MSINLSNIMREFKKAHIEFWSRQGLNEDEIVLLAEMEDFEMIDESTCEGFIPRQELILLNAITIQDVKSDIKKYKSKIEGMDL